MPIVLRSFLSYRILFVCMLICPVSCLSFMAFSQPGYQFENFTEANGLSDNRVTCFLKDKTGFIWIGTENGLNRFDGHSFLIYRPGLSHRSISNPYINDIEEDRAGRLWVSTQSGLNVIDKKDDSISVLLPEEYASISKKYTIPSDLIWDTYIDRQDRVWIAADGRELCYYDIQKKIFIYLPWRKYLGTLFPQRGRSYNSIRKIYYKSENEIWLGTSAGLFSYSSSSNTFTYYKSFEADHFIQLETSADGRTVFFVQNPVNILQELSPESGIKKDIPWSTIPFRGQSSDRDRGTGDKRWLPAGKSIAEINSTTGEATLITHLPDDPYSLPDGTIRTVYRENTGIVWAGTSNGIGKFNPSMNLFSFTEIFPFSKRGEVPENDLYRFDQTIHTVFYSKIDNQYYISSPATNSLIIKNKTTGRSRVIKNIQGIPLRHCSVIFEDSKDQLWILAGAHAFKYNRTTEQFTVSAFHSQDNNILFTDAIEDANGQLWFACLNDGLYRYDPATNISRKFSAKDSFDVSLVTSLYFDKEYNKLWIGTFEKGLYLYDFSSNKISRFIKNKKDPSHIHTSLVTDIIKDKNGMIWISTYADGISRIASAKPVNNGFTHISIQDGLAENNIFSLQNDLAGNTWATSFKGLTKIGPDGKVIAQYNRAKGLGFTDFYSPLTRTETGELLTGVSNGFISFHPDSLSYSSPEFPVIITSFRTKDSTDTKGAHSILSYDDNEVQFDFTALSYVNPGHTQYEYRLQGIDNNWVKTGNINNTKYNNLAPGSYLFKVRAFDFTGKLSSNEAIYSFRILPPWWQTWWFRTIAVLAITVLVLYLFRRRIAVIKHKALINQQMAELKGQALRAQMNPHFIFNSLNAIQELIVTENYPASYHYLSKFSKLLRMVLNMSEKNFIPLSSEIEMCQLYIELESLRFKHSFQYTIHVDEGIDAETTLFPSLLVQPFIENAVWHGLLQKKGEKKLAVNFEEINGNLVCTIRDNGIGREKALAIKMQKIGAKYLESKGTELAQQRVENLKAAGVNNATITITDCKGEDGNATGTEVRIAISSPENTEDDKNINRRR